MNDATGFPWNSAIVSDYYNQNDNYKVLDTKCNTGKIIVFFSGNALFYPNKEDSFKQKIINDDYYEWENIAKDKHIKKYYQRIVFIRDIFKQWYVTGINSRYNTVDRLIQLVSELTEGMALTTCGNSSGGYIATIVGIKLNAERIFNFSGQFSIVDQLMRQKNEAPYIHQNKDNFEISKYFSIANLLINNKTDLFYFYPAECTWDQQQSDLLHSYSRIYRFPFQSNKHGVTVTSCCYVPIFLMKNQDIINLCLKYENDTILAKDFQKNFFSSLDLKIITLKNLIYKFKKVLMKTLKNSKKHS